MTKNSRQPPNPFQNDHQSSPFKARKFDIRLTPQLFVLVLIFFGSKTPSFYGFPTQRPPGRIPNEKGRLPSHAQMQSATNAQRHAAPSMQGRLPRDTASLESAEAMSRKTQRQKMNATKCGRTRRKQDMVHILVWVAPDNLSL
ncbi:hypothetical protein VTN49DRAFT_2446 [Thermomyces lanuginosus]|uniref:uncharacterized protein n=1 Tax=Thermomyces lanuginosus TaxID=5541 RepID=UPI003744A525